MEFFLKYFPLFIIYSFLGWVLECIVVYIEAGKIMNRGFLIGPCCPIYGVGSLLIIFILNNYREDRLILFFMAAILCTILEYFTSWIMEKLFKARWWDYSDKKFNVNGRVCLENVIGFGLIGVVLVRYINPYFNSIISLVDVRIYNIVVIILLVLFIIDLSISFNIINSFKTVASSVKKDNTEEITKKVREKLINKGGLYKRLVSVFDFSASDNLLVSIKSKVMNETAKAKKIIAREQNKIKLLNKKLILEEKIERIEEELRDNEDK